jgi:glycerol-3-phosphate dehydrogenase (NAD(P)+)
MLRAMTDQVGVIGAGAWGTTLAIHLAAGQRPVTLWAHSPERREELEQHRENPRYLPGHRFPPNVRVATEESYLSEPHRLYVVAVPSAHLRAVMRSLAPALYPRADLLSVVKGIEAGTQLRMSEVIAQEVPGRRVAALSGPNLAREVAEHRPAGSVVACGEPGLGPELAAMLSSDSFRVYTNPDIVGVELAGALKNVVALAAGMVDGLGLGDSAKAGVITRGLAEMTRLGMAAGANPMTFAGLAGVGDLIATCMSPLSRNRRAGELIASGTTWKEVAAQLNGIAEGVTTAAAALELAERHGVELPIAEQVDAVLHRGLDPLSGVAALMTREPKDELASLDA